MTVHGGGIKRGSREREGANILSAAILSRKMWEMVVRRIEAAAKLRTIHDRWNRSR